MDRHPTTTIAIHWASAGLIFAMLTAGLVMTNLPPASAARLWLTRCHLAGGLAVGGLLLARLFMLLVAERIPPLPLDPLHRFGAVATRVLLYLVLAALLLSGFSTLSVGGPLGDWLTGEEALAPSLDAVPARHFHTWLSRGYLAVLVLHVAGVLLEHARRGDVLQRMGLGTSAGEPPPRG